MARPRASLEQHMEAYELHRAGFGPSAIRKFLSDRFPGSVVSLRTITTWVGGFKGLRRETVDLDSPYQWLRLDEYGLPWESGAYLLGMWAEMNEYWAWVATDLDKPVRASPTVRQVLWWWRVHLAVPDATDHLDIYLWAEDFVRYELFRDVLGESIDFAGLEAYLAYGPWRGSDKLNRYLKAVVEERIPPLPNIAKSQPTFLSKETVIAKTMPGG